MNEKYVLSETFEKIKSYIEDDDRADTQVLRYRSPTQLNDEIEFKVSQKPVSQSDFLHLVEQYFDYSVRTGHKQFLNQLYSGFNFPAFIGEVCSTLTNTSMYTYEVAPVASMIEVEMIKLMNRYVGYTHGDGTFLSGGSNANMVAMFSARNRALPESRFQGYDRNIQLKAFVNEHAHYSLDTAANLIGIGSDNVIKVKADNHGRLIPEELKKQIDASISRGEKPFFVAATCATTLMGAYDPIDEMSHICQQYNLWLHADGSFGGSIILSQQHRELMKGIEKADSFAWNPHKLMNIPLICSALLVKERGTFEKNLTDINTDYLYHDIETIEDLGKKSIQCGRKVDAVKLWFAWKYYGLDGYAERINNLIAMAEYAELKVKQHQQLELLVPRQSFTVCFRLNPTQKQLDLSQLNTLNLQLRELLRKQGKTLVNYGYLGEILTIRLVTANAELQQADIDLFFDYISAEAEQMIRVC